MKNQINKTSRIAMAMLAAGLALGTTACEEDTTEPTSLAKTIMGDTADVGNGKAMSWLKLDDAGKPTSIGITFTEAAMEGLPTTPFPPTEWVLTLPAEASVTAYNHIGLDWNAQGHEPTSIYTIPHFDMHFYQITPAERAAITPADSLTGYIQPGADYIAKDYILPPGIVPGMGFHAVDSTAHELHGHTFDKTFIYGYFKGNMIFGEPMITRAYLLTKPDFSETLKVPAKYPVTGKYYATKYSIKYDAAKKEYVVSLDGLTMR